MVLHLAVGVWELSGVGGDACCSGMRVSPLMVAGRSKHSLMPRLCVWSVSRVKGGPSAQMRWCLAQPQVSSGDDMRRDDRFASARDFELNKCNVVIAVLREPGSMN